LTGCEDDLACRKQEKKEIQFKMFCLPVETNSPSAEIVKGSLQVICEWMQTFK